MNIGASLRWLVGVLLGALGAGAGFWWGRGWGVLGKSMGAVPPGPGLGALLGDQWLLGWGLGISVAVGVILAAVLAAAQCEGWRAVMRGPRGALLFAWALTATLVGKLIGKVW